MEERRRFLQTVPLASLGALGLAAGSEQLFATPERARQEDRKYDPRKQRSVPDVAGVAHTGQAFRFYGDLVKDRVVAINFMSIRSEEQYPVTARMAEIARRLGGRLGRDVFMISVTRDPDYDTPERLAMFAKDHRVPNKGWLFVNCAVDGADALQARIYHAHDHSGPIQTMSHSSAQHSHLRTTDTVFYGHGGLGLWSNFPVEIHADQAVRHISWVMPGKKLDGILRRAGPRPLHSSGLSSDNRIAEKV